MSCEGGLNTVVALNVPGSDQSDGNATDVSGLVGEKSVEISGTYQGSYVIIGSHDGVKYVPLLIFNSGAGVQSFKQTMNFIVRFIKVRRRATNLSAVGISVGSQATCAC